MSGVDVPGHHDDVDALYGLPLDQFTKARDELVRALRSAGDRATAAAVKTLRKPSVPAWALNQVARSDSAVVDKLLDAGREVRAASDRALRGDATQLRDASRALHERAGDAADAAAAVLTAAGRPPTPATADRILSTARAVAVDDAGSEQLRRGMLTDDVEPAGFGLDGLDLAGTPVAAPTGTDDGDDEDDGEAASAAARRAAERQREKLDAEIERVVHRAQRTAGEIEELERRLATARTKHEELEAELDDLRDRRRDITDQ